MTIWAPWRPPHRSRKLSCCMVATVVCPGRAQCSCFQRWEYDDGIVPIQQLHFVWSKDQGHYTKKDIDSVLHANVRDAASTARCPAGHSLRSPLHLLPRPLRDAEQRHTCVSARSRQTARQRWRRGNHEHDARVRRSATPNQPPRGGCPHQTLCRLIENAEVSCMGLRACHKNLVSMFRFDSRL